MFILNKTHCLWLFTLMFTLFSLNAHAEICTSFTRVNSICSVPILELHPTQGYLGFKSVELKLKKLKKKRENGTLEDYLGSHPIPIVISNGERFYPVDHHHLAKAALDLGLTTIPATVVAQWNLTGAAFWDKMNRMHYVYLKDMQNRSILPSDLPNTLLGCQDDPYRSLSAEVRDQGGYAKESTDYFIEFKWANFFRSRISLSLLLSDFDEAVEKGLKLARHTDNPELP